MAFKPNTVEKMMEDIESRINEVNRMEKLYLNVFTQALYRVSDVLSGMLALVLKARNERDYIGNNFEFQEQKKKIDEIANSTNVNEVKLLLGDPDLIVDKMKDSPMTMLKKEFGIQNILIDQENVEKIVKVSYAPKSDVLLVKNRTNGHQDAETIQGRKLDHKAFNNVGIGIVFNENFEKFKKAFEVGDETQNKTYKLEIEDAILNISSVEIEDVHGYVGDILGLDVDVRVKGNLYEGAYFVIKAESGDFVAKFNPLKLQEGKYIEITLSRDISIEEDKMRSDSICLGMKIDINTFTDNMFVEEEIYQKIFQLNELRYTLLFYRDRLPYNVRLLSRKDNDKVYDVPLYPITIETLNLETENLYSDEAIEHALWKVLNALNFINSEKNKVEKILALEPTL